MEEQKPVQKQGASRTRIAVIVIVVIAIVGVGGWLISRYIFNKVAETATESIIGGITGGDVDIDSEGNAATISSEDGTFQMSAKSEWPESMPTSVPEFKYGSIEGSATSSVSDGTGWSVSFKDVKSGAYESYRNELTSGGWTETSTVATTSKMSNMENDEHYLVFTVNESDQTGSLIITKK